MTIVWQKLAPGNYVFYVARKDGEIIYKTNSRSNAEKFVRENS